MRVNRPKRPERRGQISGMDLRPSGFVNASVREDLRVSTVVFIDKVSLKRLHALRKHFYDCSRQTLMRKGVQMAFGF